MVSTVACGLMVVVMSHTSRISRLTHVQCSVFSFVLPLYGGVGNLFFSASESVLGVSTYELIFPYPYPFLKLTTPSV